MLRQQDRRKFWEQYLCIRFRFGSEIFRADRIFFREKKILSNYSWLSMIIVNHWIEILNEKMTLKNFCYICGNEQIK